MNKVLALLAVLLTFCVSALAMYIDPDARGGFGFHGADGAPDRGDG